MTTYPVEDLSAIAHECGCQETVGPLGNIVFFQPCDGCQQEFYQSTSSEEPDEGLPDYP